MFGDDFDLGPLFAFGMVVLLFSLPTTLTPLPFLRYWAQLAPRRDQASTSK